MRSYSVAARGLGSVEVHATNWIIALGSGLEQLGRAEDIGRLACEVLPNGTVIARDISSGTGFIVQLAEPIRPPLVADDDVIEAGAEPDELDEVDSADDALAACVAALEIATRKIRAESGAVLLLSEPGGQTLSFVAAIGPHRDALEGLEFPANAGVAGYAIQKRRSVVLGSAAEDPRHYAEFDQRLGYHTRDMAVVPVAVDGRVFGVIEVLNLPIGRRFTRENITEMQQVAQSLAIRLRELGAPPRRADDHAEFELGDE
jgi:hypothetical protein